MGWAEVATGAGLAIGPVIGSIIFSFFGYELAFIIYGILLLFSSIPMILLIPTSVNKKSEPAIGEDNSKEINGKEIVYSMFFFNYKCFITLLTCSILLLMINFLDSILSV